jgi:hypothetical protein
MASEHRPRLDTHNVPDADGRDRNLRKDRRPVPGAGEEERGIDRTIADAEKTVRSGSTDEPVRNTPPFGDHDEAPFVERNKPARDDKH